MVIIKTAIASVIQPLARPDPASHFLAALSLCFHAARTSDMLC